eukprot:4498482-Alexandrium_andersonii.AAC.1
MQCGRSCFPCRNIEGPTRLALVLGTCGKVPFACVQRDPLQHGGCMCGSLISEVPQASSQLAGRLQLHERKQ